jgi:hypothetical protein
MSELINGLGVGMAGAGAEPMRALLAASRARNGDAVRCPLLEGFRSNTTTMGANAVTCEPRRGPLAQDMTGEPVTEVRARSLAVTASVAHVHWYGSVRQIPFGPPPSKAGCRRTVRPLYRTSTHSGFETIPFRCPVRSRGGLDHRYGPARSQLTWHQEVPPKLNTGQGGGRDAP